MKAPLISVAPMMAWTDRHYRALMRLITRHTLLYTEMLTTSALLHGNRDYLLEYSKCEHPVAIQLGGSHPAELAEAAAIAQDYGYDEINLNVGCPSDRVQSGQFGACLMLQPQLVAECVSAMKARVEIPVTVKTRIGVDEQDSYAELHHFIQSVSAAGCESFIVHARKAWLKGLSPKENREIPPLRYEVVYQLKQDFPSLHFILNGGIKTIEAAQMHLSYLDGVMMGREAYANPYALAHVDQCFYGDTRAPLTQTEVVRAYLPYVAEQLQRGVRLRSLIRHLLGLFQGQPGARQWRRHLSEQGGEEGLGIRVIEAALLRLM